MPFFSATADVRSVILAGGLDMAARLLSAGWDYSTIFNAIRSRYAPMGRAPYANAVYQSIIDRAASSLESGNALQRKRSNSVIDDSLITGSVGLENTYQYTVVGEFMDDASGKKFSRPFIVSSSDALGKFDVLSLARQQALAWTGGEATLTGGMYADYTFLGQLKVTEARKEI